jgi:hypothetical protein
VVDSALGVLSIYCAAVSQNSLEAQATGTTAAESPNGALQTNKVLVHTGLI